MRASIIFAFLLVFAFGWAASSVLNPMFMLDTEQPFSFSWSFDKAAERASPSNHIEQDSIHVYHDRIVLDIKDAIFAKYADTNSMDPLLDKDANGIEIKPSSPVQIKVGDVISYKSTLTKSLLVHRVVSRGYDDNGHYFITKGDNNPSVDPEKIRFSQVHGLLIGVIY